MYYFYKMITYTYIVFFLIAHMLLFRGYAQEADQEMYPFVRYDLNRISFFGDSSDFGKFYEKVGRLVNEQQGQLHVMHYGGSHIQADVWSGEVRRSLQRIVPWGSAGRGLVFPYSMARTNNPWNYETRYSGRWEGCKNTQEDTDCVLGLPGMAVTTKDPDADFTIYNRRTDTLDYTFNRVKVFHVFDRTQYRIALQHPEPQVVKVVNPEIGYTEFTFPDYRDTVAFQLVRKDDDQQEFTLLGLSLESDRPGFYYHALGVNGADVPDHLRSGKATDHLKVIRPDLVVFSIGINDAYHPGFDPEVYKIHYRQLIKRIKSQAPDAALLFTTNNDSYYKRRHPNKNGLLVKQAMEELAAETGAGVWDMFSIMGGLGSVDAWVEHGLAKMDRIHFKPDGYRLLGRLLFSAIMEGYNGYTPPHRLRSAEPLAGHD